MLSIPLVIRAVAVLAINWFIKDIGTPPPEADGANQMGAQEGDKPAPEGKPNSIIKSLFSLIPTFATLYYGANYWSEDSISIYDIVVFTIALSGYSLRQWACHALGKFHTFGLGVRKDHRLIESGPYQWLVHPSYTGQFLCYLGTLLFLRFPWYLTLATMAFTIYSIRKRTRVEELAFSEHFENYSEYLKRRKRFIPFVF